MIKFTFIKAKNKIGWTKPFFVAPNQKEKIYLDGRFGYAIFYKNKYQGVISFKIKNNQCHICQIQGSNHKSKEYILPRMKLPFIFKEWEKLLIKKVFLFCRANNIQKITILEAKNSRWLKKNSNPEKPENQVEIDQLKKRYDRNKKTVEFYSGKLSSSTTF